MSNFSNPAKILNVYVCVCDSVELYSRFTEGLKAKSPISSPPPPPVRR